MIGLSLLVGVGLFGFFTLGGLAIWAVWSGATVLTWGNVVFPLTTGVRLVSVSDFGSLLLRGGRDQRVFDWSDGVPAWRGYVRDSAVRERGFDDWEENGNSGSVISEAGALGKRWLFDDSRLWCGVRDTWYRAGRSVKRVLVHSGKDQKKVMYGKVNPNGSVVWLKEIQYRRVGRVWREKRSRSLGRS